MLICLAGFVLDRAGASDLLPVKVGHLALHLQGLLVKDLHAFVCPINKKEFLLIVLQLNFGQHERHMLRHFMLELKLDYLSQLFVFVPHDQLGYLLIAHVS